MILLGFVRIRNLLEERRKIYGNISTIHKM